MVANEMFLDSAIQRESVVSLAKLLNYTPKSSIAPEATINVLVNQVTDASLTLPKNTPFLSENIDGVNYSFVTTDSSTVAVSGQQALFSNVTIKQGIVASISYEVDSTTNPTYTFSIPDENVDTTMQREPNLQWILTIIENFRAYQAQPVQVYATSDGGWGGWVEGSVGVL